MTTELREEQLVRDEILHLPIDVIDPDPAQPRLQVDTELADSIAQYGVLQAIQVRPHPENPDRWMIVDGERRYRGSLAAKAKTIPATITYDVDGVQVADRLIRQIVRNTGKPLTAVEQAKAFKRIIDERRAGGDKGYGVVQLAKELGVAKSTISDRMALAQLPDFWLELIAKGPLQPSHAPLIAKWLPVPEKYHQKALEQMKLDYRWTQRRSKDGGIDERIYVDVFETLLDQYMPKFLKPLSEVPGYEGPTMKAPTRHSYPARVVVHAADPSKWQSIFRKRVAEKRAEGESSSSSRGGKQKDAPTPRWVTALVDAGATLKQGEGFSDYNAPKGQTKIGDQEGKRAFAWWYGHPYGTKGQRFFDPAALLRDQDPAKLLVYLSQQWDGVRVALVTKDTEALGVARKAYDDARQTAWEVALDATGRELLAAGSSAGRDALVMGGGAPHLVRSLIDADKDLLGTLLALAKASQAAGALDVESTEPAARKYLLTLAREPAETLLNAIVCVERDKVKTPTERLDAWHAAQLARYAKVQPVLKADAATAAAATPTPRRRKNAVDEEALNAEATGASEPPTCIYCECDEAHACELEDGSPCSWASEDPRVCTAPACLSAFEEDRDSAADGLDEDEALEPAEAEA